MPSTILWNVSTSPKGGDWDTPGNWVGGMVPKANDDAIINLSTGTVTHLLPTFDSVSHVTTNASTTLTLNAGTLSIASASNLNSTLILNGGNLAGTGTVNVQGAISWYAGNMTGNGSTVANGVLNIGQTANGSMTAVHLSGGRTLKIYANASLTTSASGGSQYGLYLSDGSTVINEPGANFGFSANASINDAGGTPSGGSFLNLGTLTAAKGSGTSTIGVPFYNSGTINVQMGSLALTEGGGFTGKTDVFNIASGSTLDFAGGTFNGNAGTTIQAPGSGYVRLLGGTLNLAGPTQLANLVETAGILGGSGTLSIAGILEWDGGTMTDSGITEVHGTFVNYGHLTNASATLAGGRVLKNFNVASIRGNNLNASGGSSIVNLSGATFNLNGMILTSGPSSGTTFNNQGILNAQGAAGLGMALKNVNVVNVNDSLTLGGGGSFTGGSSVVNLLGPGGSLNFTAGTFTENSGASILGGLNSRVDVNGATVSIAGVYRGIGFTQVEAGELDFNTAAELGSLVVSGGTLGGNGTLTVDGLTNWIGGTMTGAGSTEAKGGLSLAAFNNPSGATSLFLKGGRTLINDSFGTLGMTSFVVVPASLYVSDGSTLKNGPGATFSLLNLVSILNNNGFPTGGTFVNQGTFINNTGARTANVGIAFDNQGTLGVPSGTLQLSGPLKNLDPTTSTLNGGAYLISGTLALANASIRNNNATIVLSGPIAAVTDLNGNNAFANLSANLAGGSLALQAGANLNLGTLNNAGMIQVGANGILAISGGYNQSGGGTVLSGGTLGGALINSTLSGGFLNGNGSILGNLINGGQLLPGDLGATGTLSVSGNYTQTSPGSLMIQIGGTVDPGGNRLYDRLDVGGLASLNGMLGISTVNGYLPPDDAVFRPLTFTSKSSDFGTTTGLDFGRCVLVSAYDASGLNLTVNQRPVTTAPAIVAYNGVATFPLTATDSETDPALLVFTITSLPVGTLSLPNGTVLGLGSTFTGSGTLLTYTPAAANIGEVTDSFAYTVSDSGVPPGNLATALTSDPVTVNLKLDTSPTSGIVTVDGTSEDDVIVASDDGSGKLVVTVNGVANATGLLISNVSQLNIYGNDGNDTITLAGIGVNADLDGGSGINSLNVDGTDGPDVFGIQASSVGFEGKTITGGPDTLNVNGLGGNDTFTIGLDFNQANLNGGDGDDVFQLNDLATLTGSIDGGTGTNTVDMSDRFNPVTVDLGAGTMTGVTGMIANLENFKGNPSLNNTIKGPAVGTVYSLTSGNGGTIGPVEFSGFNKIVGGAGNDTFAIADGVTFTGTLDGGDGTNTLDEAAFKSQVDIQLGPQIATGLSNPFVRFQNFVGGSNPANIIFGPFADTTYTINGPNSGIIGTDAFKNFASLGSYATDDLFVFLQGGSLSGTLSGGEGFNTIDVSTFTRATNLNLALSTMPGIIGSYTGIQNFIGGSNALNTLSGYSVQNFFQFNGRNSGTDNAISFANFAIINGGPAYDFFTFVDGGGLTGSIDGGPGSNQLVYSGYTGQVTVDLGNSRITGILGTFANVQTIVGGSNVGNKLIGPATGSTFQITTGPINVGSFEFINFPVLVGGAGNDAFVFPSQIGKLKIATILGGGGINTLDESAATQPIVVDLTRSTATGITGSFANIQKVIGGTAADTLRGPSSDSIYTINGTNQGSVDGVQFLSFNTLIGGPGNDTFAFLVGGGLSGKIDGGGGRNTLDYTPYTAPVVFDVGRSLATSMVNPFSNIQRAIGGSNSANILLGPVSTDTTFYVNGPNSGDVNTSSFVKFGRIVAGSGNDVFMMADGASLSSFIDGGGGSNWIDYSPSTQPVMVNLTAGGASRVNLGIGHIENARGGSGNDTLIGDFHGNVLVGGPGNDVLRAGTGRSFLIGGTGSDTLVGGLNDDILVAGATSFDGHLGALDAILSEWQSSDSYAVRVALIRQGGGPNGSARLKRGVTVFDDTVANVLRGNGGQDWFLQGPLDGNDAGSGEQIN